MSTCPDHQVTCLRIVVIFGRVSYRWRPGVGLSAGTRAGCRRWPEGRIGRSGQAEWTLTAVDAENREQGSDEIGSEYVEPVK